MASTALQSIVYYVYLAWNQSQPKWVLLLYVRYEVYRISSGYHLNASSFYANKPYYIDSKMLPEGYNSMITFFAETPDFCTSKACWISWRPRPTPYGSGFGISFPFFKACGTKVFQIPSPTCLFGSWMMENATTRYSDFVISYEQRENNVTESPGKGKGSECLGTYHISERMSP